MEHQMNKEQAYKLYIAALLEDIPGMEAKRAEYIKGQEELYQQFLARASKLAAAGADVHAKHEVLMSPMEGLKNPEKKRAYGIFPSVQELDSKGFPLKKSEIKGAEAAKAELWKDFKKDVDELPTTGLKDLKRYSIKLHTLLEHYASRLPSVSQAHADVSFFDFNRLRAAVVYSLCQLEQEEQQEEKAFALVRADISGIQNYIYGIASKNASKNLKGRSFYIQLLGDVVLQLLMKELELVDGQVIYASGGNFFLLLPHTKKLQATLDLEGEGSFIQRLQKALFKQYAEKLSVIMAYQPVAEADLNQSKPEGLTQAIEELFQEKIGRAKKRQLAFHIKNTAHFFDPIEEEISAQRHDVMTGDMISANERRIWSWDRTEDETETIEPSYFLKDESNLESDEAEGDSFLSEDSAMQIIAGRRLREAKYLVFSVDEKIEELDEVLFVKKTDRGITRYSPRESSAHLQPLRYAKEYGLAAVDVFITKGNELWNKLDRSRVQTIWALKKVDEKSSSSIGAELKTVDFITVYGGNSIAKIKDASNPKPNRPYQIRPKTFEELASNLLTEQQEEQLKNKNREKLEEGLFTRLGVLRMDVDGLGATFQKHIPYINAEQKSVRPHLSLAYYSAVSHQLDWFFKGWLNRIWEDEETDEKSGEKISEYSQIIYAGGDDLFIVGRWNILMEMAIKIKDDFERFGCALAEKDRLTLSGGLAIVREKFPILKAAEIAGKLEEQAKKHKFEEDGKEALRKKNSIAFFSKHPLHWDTEFKLVYHLYNNLTEVEEDKLAKQKGKLPRSILGRIQGYYKMMEEYDGEKKSPRWIWMAAYDLGRLSKSYNDSGLEAPENKEEILKAKNALEKIKAGIFTNKYTGVNGDDNFEHKSHYHFLELLNVAARWAEFETRAEDAREMNQ
ncbi:CRISPR-associated protein, Csm1 family [Saprospira grandis str. Lewin]|uniref:CRISPR system single-strand-specific deoxyribonuclease Cas10/Csm1 (subtype III-A) n=2 Tax=Saprospira TaxID=1007 RepID=H6L657_SAPGL|nr:CRISPR-associated protein, Csm1 family [Saprospira grandis str. Lewin]